MIGSLFRRLDDDQFHRDERSLLVESQCFSVEIRSCLFFLASDEFEFIEFRNQFSSNEWLVFDSTLEWKNINTIRCFLSRLVRSRRHQRLFSLSFLLGFFSTHVDRFFVGFDLSSLSSCCSRFFSIVDCHSRSKRLSGRMEKSLVD